MLRFSERAPVGRHTLPGAPINCGRFAVERGVAGALIMWGRGEREPFARIIYLSVQKLCKRNQACCNVASPGNFSPGLEMREKERGEGGGEEKRRKRKKERRKIMK